MAMARLRFGGPNLPDNAVTFYRHVNPDGQFVGMINISPGAEIDEARVMDAQSYVDRGMAARIDDKGNVIATAAVAAKEE
jgi:hypothetical protein